MERYLVSSLGVLLAASIGAFLLYVPTLPLVAVAMVLVGFVLTFFLGLCLGAQETVPIGGAAIEKMREWWRRLV